MSRFLPILRREYVERIRSKSFIVVTVLGPVLMAGVVLLPAFLMQKERGHPLRLAVIDDSPGVREAVENAIDLQRSGSERRFIVDRSPLTLETARRSVLEGRLDGFVYLPPGAVETPAAEYHARNVSNFADLGLVERAVDEALVARRLQGAGIDPSRVESLTKRLDLRTIRMSEGGEHEEKGPTTFLFAFLLAGLLYTTVAIWGAALMNGVIEEKTNRVVEIIVSSVDAKDFFAGKLLGVGGVGLTQFLVWATFLAVLGIYAAPAVSGLQGPLPEIPLMLIASFVLFFLLGYFLYASLYAAIGASVNTQQEAQVLVFPVLLPLMMAYILCPVVIGNPDGALATVLSLIPLLTPILMFVRITALQPPFWQIATSLVLMGVSIVVVNRLAARIYRVGILMYGKRPTFAEILRWSRTP